MQGQQPGQGSRIDGFVINFKSAAKEKSGRVVLGQAHLRLVGETSDGNSIAIHPIALVSQADASAPISGRWRFDDGQGLFIGSVGGGAEWPVAAEFVVPQGFVPRGALHPQRALCRAREAVAYATVEARDMAIASGSLTAAGGASIDVASLDESRATTVRGNNNGYTGVNLGRQLGFVLQEACRADSRSTRTATSSTACSRSTPRPCAATGASIASSQSNASPSPRTPRSCRSTSR